MVQWLGNILSFDFWHHMFPWTLPGGGPQHLGLWPWIPSTKGPKAASHSWPFTQPGDQKLLGGGGGGAHTAWVPTLPQRSNFRELNSSMSGLYIRVRVSSNLKFLFYVLFYIVEVLNIYPLWVPVMCFTSETPSLHYPSGNMYYSVHSVIRRTDLDDVLVWEHAASQC